MLKYFLIVNPMSGHKKGRSILNKIEGLFKDAQIEVVTAITTHNNHPFELAQSIPLDDFDAICIVGGDGTFHEVINGMLKRADHKRLPLGFIPAGTGNSMMHDLDCLDPVKAVHKILENKFGKLDIFEIDANGELFYGFNILGWGMPAAINLTAEKMRWMGGQRYNIATLIEVMKNRTRKVKFILDGKSIEGQFEFFLVCNTMYTGNGMKMVPDAKMDDGWLDILIVKHIGRLKLLSLFAKVFKGKHIGDSAIDHYRVKEFSILSSSQDPLIIDGQNIGQTPIQAKVLTEQLEIFI